MDKKRTLIIGGTSRKPPLAAPVRAVCIRCIQWNDLFITLHNEQGVWSYKESLQRMR